jgi:hypothetical protein
MRYHVAVPVMAIVALAGLAECLTYFAIAPAPVSQSAALAAPLATRASNVFRSSAGSRHSRAVPLRALVSLSGCYSRSTNWDFEPGAILVSSCPSGASLF